MSRTKNLEKTEAENTVSENLVEQSGNESVTESTSVESSATETSTVTAKSTASTTTINKVATVSSVKGNKRMGVNKFLQFYPQNIYVEALLKRNYPRTVFTVDEWFLRIEELLNRPIYN